MSTADNAALRAINAELRPAHQDRVAAYCRKTPPTSDLALFCLRMIATTTQAEAQVIRDFAAMVVGEIEKGSTP